MRACVSKHPSFPPGTHKNAGCWPTSFPSPTLVTHVRAVLCRKGRAVRHLTPRTATATHTAKYMHTHAQVDNQLFIANAGDSRAVLCRKGRAVRLTEDHHPDVPSEAERVLAAGGDLHRTVRGLSFACVPVCMCVSFGAAVKNNVPSGGGEGACCRRRP